MGESGGLVSRIDKLFELEPSAEAFAFGASVLLSECRAALDKRHPGKLIGQHWLEVAYERICAGESEVEVMADYGYRREG